VGKTLLALQAGLQQLDRVYDKIILSKPVVPMGRDLGFLPGSEAEKIHPWMMSFFDNLDQLLTTDKKENLKRGTKEKNWEHLVQSGHVEIQPMHTIRGRSIPRSFMLFDEIQNATPHEIKTVVSRAATGTKVVLCGDPSQIDDPFLDSFSNGLVHAAKMTRGSALAGTVCLTDGVRSPLSDLAARMM
jgi:PhoH-like ATPase